MGELASPRPFPRAPDAPGPTTRATPLQDHLEERRPAWVCVPPGLDPGSQFPSSILLWILTFRVIAGFKDVQLMRIVCECKHLNHRVQNNHNSGKKTTPSEFLSPKVKLKHFVTFVLIIWKQKHRKEQIQEGHSWDFPGGPVAKTPRSQCPGSIPGQGTRFHMMQLGVRMLQVKIPHAATKTRRGQIN